MIHLEWKGKNNEGEISFTSNGALSGELIGFRDLICFGKLFPGIFERCYRMSEHVIRKASFAFLQLKNAENEVNIAF